MHYAGHWREAFCAWIEEGTPPLARVEVDYEPVTWTAEELLGRMVHCTNIMPGVYCDLAHI
jgi:hypothetical protein